MFLFCTPDCQLHLLLSYYQCVNFQAYASEIFRDEYQATAMSAVSTAWGIGLIIGPALGGFLAQVSRSYLSFYIFLAFQTLPYVMI
jgi:MFS family permease